MYTLVVVDMQATFKAANNHEVRKNCLREIMLAILHDNPIVFLEYVGCSETLTELKPSIMRNYYFRTKFGNDGSKEVVNTVEDHDLPKSFRVCGVNTDACVQETVCGITKRLPDAKIDVVADACDSNYDHKWGLNKMKSFSPLVTIVE